MNIYASECRRSFCAAPFLRRGFALFAAITGCALHAQLTTISQTYSVPHLVDGSALSVFFDFSSQPVSSSASINKTSLSLSFSKEADLSDDPPFYSEIGLVLRKLDTHFAVVKEATLVELGSFNDGEPFTFFDDVLTFDDSALTVVNDDPDQLVGGTFRGEQPLSLLNGAYSPYWELRIVDDSSQNPLIFHSATLTVTASAPNASIAPVPEPAVLGLSGAVLMLGIAVLRERRRTRV